MSRRAVAVVAELLAILLWTAAAMLLLATVVGLATGCYPLPVCF